MKSCRAPFLVWTIRAASNNSHVNWWSSVCVIIFLCAVADIIVHNSYSNFVQVSNYLKVTHTCQSFLEHNSKLLLYRSMEQLGMPCVKKGEGFYFDCNISHFGVTNLSWYSMWAFCSCSISYGTYVGFTTKKILGHTWRFQGRMGGLNRKRHFDLLRDKLGTDVAPNYANENTLSAYLSDLNLSISPYSVLMRENMD